jgi:phage protein D
MLHPSYKLQIASNILEPRTSDNVVSIYVNLSMNMPTDIFEVILRMSDKSLKFKQDDDVSVSLGYDQQHIEVFKGKVNSVKSEVSKLRVISLNSIWKLINQRMNRLYEKQSAGKIVSDLAKVSGVATGDIMDGISFPSYVIDDNKNVYEHIRELAERCGFDVYVTSNNKLTFRKYSRDNVHTFEYGKNVISADGYYYKPEFSSVKVFGESPSSTKGSDTWHWLTKKEVEGVAGSGSAFIITDPVLRDKDTAEKVAKAKLNTLNRNLFVTIETVGKPEVKLGDTVEIKSMPDSKLNGDFQVRSVEHIFNKSEGFKTIIGCRSVK